MPILAITTLLYHTYLNTYFQLEIQPKRCSRLFKRVRASFAISISLQLYSPGLYGRALLSRHSLSCANPAVWVKRALFSALLFALIHLHVPALLPILLLGIVLNLLYWFTGNLWSAIALHVLFNTISISVAQLNLV